MGRVFTERHECVWGPGHYQSERHHTEVWTAADNPEDFDPRVLGPTPNDYQYGYCSRCKQPMRWSVRQQRWVDWNPTGSPPADWQKSPRDHPNDERCSGLAATWCEIHGTCICGKCCMDKVWVVGIEPRLIFDLEGAVVYVGNQAVVEHDLNDVHCPLHGLPW